MTGKKEHINPDGLFKNPAFSQAIITQGSGKTIYIGGQDAVDINGNIVGKGDIATQTEQTMKNVQTVLEACGATFNDLVKLTIYVVSGQDITKGFEASRKYFKDVINQPIVTVIIVPVLGRPDFLLEVDGIAFVAE
ncbi:MAG: RidA family protein [Taibaiella sp.]|nr:RidA family protein [Taibaiella sp.]